jgi:hypothetical protein
MPSYKDARSRYKWNDTAGRYRGPDGRFISFSRVRFVLDDVIDGNERDMVNLAMSLREGRITVTEFQRQMRGYLKDIHVSSGALAKGGWAQLSHADLGRIGVRVKEQYKYLDNFAGELARADVFDGNLVRRTRLYAQSGRITYHRIQREEMRKRGYTEEKNVLAQVEHCKECVAEAKRGWVPIGTLSLIGTRICKSNDRCYIEYR